MNQEKHVDNGWQRVMGKEAGVSNAGRTKVLVIDDSDTARLAVKAVLVRAEFEVFDLPSAIGATRTLLRNAIGVVIIDLGMPGLSGDRLVSLLRNNPRLQGLVIVVVSGTRVAELERVAAEIDVDAVLPKDLIPTRLVKLINDLVQQRAAQAARAPT